MNHTLSASPVPGKIAAYSLVPGNIATDSPGQCIAYKHDIWCIL